MTMVKPNPPPKSFIVQKAIKNNIRLLKEYVIGDNKEPIRKWGWRVQDAIHKNYPTLYCIAPWAKCYDIDKQGNVCPLLIPGSSGCKLETLVDEPMSDAERVILAVEVGAILNTLLK